MKTNFKTDVKSAELLRHAREPGTAATISVCARLDGGSVYAAAGAEGEGLATVDSIGQSGVTLKPSKAL
jgi:hypothetical protein